MDIREGMNIRFVPSGWVSGEGEYCDRTARTAEGLVERVNEEHGWFRVAYIAKGETCHECFKLPILMQDRIKKIWA